MTEYYWPDYMGNYVSPDEAMHQYFEEANGRTLEQWVFDTIAELFPASPVTIEEANKIADNLLVNLGALKESEAA